MKLSDWAKENGITYKTAWRWWKAGKLPVSAYQTETGTILIGKKPKDLPNSAAIFVQKTADRVEDDHEVRRMRAWAERRGFTVSELVMIARLSRLPRLVRKHYRVLILQPGLIDELTLKILCAALKKANRQVLIYDD
jgi:predicted site-specific integrase-resolvase